MNEHLVKSQDCECNKQSQTFKDPLGIESSSDFKAAETLGDASMKEIKEQNEFKSNPDVFKACAILKTKKCHA